MGADRSEAARLEDQGEWERTNSYQRMFLALHDESKSMDRVAEALLVLVARYRPASEQSFEAANAFYQGGADDAQARPVYMVFCMVERAINEPVSPAPPPGGGARMICQAIRREYPLAPVNFRKVGKLERHLSEQEVSDRELLMPLTMLGIPSE